MPNPNVTAGHRIEPSNTRRVYEVSRRDLPVHCPPDDAALWSSHPRVYLPLEEGGEVRCPYCSALFRWVD